MLARCAIERGWEEHVVEWSDCCTSVRGCLFQKRCEAGFCAGWNGESKLSARGLKMARIGSQRSYAIDFVGCMTIATRWLMKCG